MSRTKNATRNIFWGALSKFVTLGLPFITRTVMIYTLGMDYVGLGSLFSSILQVLSFAELGIGSALVFSMYKPLAEGDDVKVSALLNLYRKTYRVIGSVILMTGLVMMPFLNHLVASDLPSGINLQVLFIIYLVNNLAGYFMFAYKQSLFTASQRIDVISKLGICLSMLSAVASIVVLLTLRNYYAYVMIIPAITIINNIFLGVLSNKAFPQYKCFGTVADAEKKVIEKKVRGMLFQKIGNIILTSADTIVISSFLGLKILGIYNGYYYVITVLFGFLSVVQSAMIPAIGNSAITDSVEKNLNDFRKFQLLYLWIVIWWCACLLGMYQPFIELWQGSDNMLSNSIVVLLVAYFFVYKMGDINWMYREAMGLWWEARFVPFVSSIVNLVLNIILVNFIGLPGILISTIVALAFVNFPWSSKVLFSLYFKSKKEWFAYLLRTVAYFFSMVIVTFITWEVCKVVHESGFLNLILRGCICLILPNLLLILLNVWNKDFKPAGQFVLKILPSRMVPRFVKRYFA